MKKVPSFIMVPNEDVKKKSKLEFFVKFKKKKNLKYKQILKLWKWSIKKT